MSTRKAKRELAKYAQTGRNWRLMGLLAAHPRVPSQLRADDLASAWPTTGTERKRLGVDQAKGRRFKPDKAYAMPEGDDGRVLMDAHRLGKPSGISGYRRLSDATKEGDWQDGPWNEKQIHADRAISRALAYEDSVENLDVLFRKEIFDTVIEGARKAEIARDATTSFPVDRQQGDHPRGQDTQFAADVVEGGPIEDNAQSPDTIEWDTDKFGDAATATDELLEQSLISVVEMQVQWLGHTTEMKNNRKWLNNLLDNVDTNNDVDASSEDNRGWAAINKAIEQVELNDEMPSAAVMHPSFTYELFNTAENNAVIPKANEFGDDEGIRDRVAFPLLGLEGFRGSDGVADGSTTWDYTGADEFGAVVYDTARVGMYLFKDIEMKEYEDPVRDLQGVNARMEVDHVWHQDSAGARINHG